MLKGIDVSSHQGNIDWNRVKKSGKADFAMFRLGYGNDISQKDKQLDNNLKGANAVGIQWGGYWFSYAISVEDAIREAKVCIEVLKPYKQHIKYPIVFDFEYDSVRYCKDHGVTPTKQLVNDMAVAFCKVLKDNGYYPALYTNQDYMNNYWLKDKIGHLDIWYALYPNTVDLNRFNGVYPMWQYTESGKVDGIAGNVDMNVCYVDYPSKINSSTPAPSPSPTPSGCDKEIKRYNENGKCTITAGDGIRFRNKPCTHCGVQQGVYSCGEYVYYDLVVITEKYVWISWVGASSGQRRYMPIKVRATGERWGNCV